ncbi:MAG: hypothetical protein U1E19_10485 [Rhodoblastus sp.]
MTSNRLRLLAIAWFALLPAALQAAPLEATALYREKARDCRAVDLGTWAHPTRKVMEGHRVEIQKVELCNDGVYPVFTVGLPGDPVVGINDSYFNKLHARMIEANGLYSYAFVDSARGVIIYVNMTAKREATIDYEEFDPAKTR